MLKGTAFTNTTVTAAVAVNANTKHENRTGPIRLEHRMGLWPGAMTEDLHRAVRSPSSARDGEVGNFSATGS